MVKDLEEKLIGFFEKKNMLKYEKGEIIYRTGEFFNNVSFIKSGYVRLYSITNEGKENTISNLKPVFIMSLLYTLQNKENNYYFEAVTDVEFWKAPIEEFYEFIDKNPQIYNELLKYALETIGTLVESISSLKSGSAAFKTANLLLSLTENYGSKKNGELSIDFEITHEIIASIVGVTRETVSTQIKKLERKNLIKQEKSKIIILEPQKLKNSDL